MKSAKFIIPGILLFAMFSASCGNSGNAAPTDTATKVQAKDTANDHHATVENNFAKGEEVYNTTCKACHQANGEGIASTFPPLAKSDYLNADKLRSIKQVINGSTGEITVNGNTFNGVMPPQALSDEQIADVLNYVFHSWGNNGETVSIEEVKAAH